MKNAAILKFVWVPHQGASPPAGANALHDSPVGCRMSSCLTDLLSDEQLFCIPGGDMHSVAI